MTTLKTVALTGVTAYGLYRITHPKGVVQIAQKRASNRPSWQGDVFENSQAPKAKPKSKALLALQLFFGALLGRALYKRFFGPRLHDLLSAITHKFSMLKFEQELAQAGLRI